jgi:hypothetical protein
LLVLVTQSQKVSQALDLGAARVAVIVEVS